MSACKYSAKRMLTIVSVQLLCVLPFGAYASDSDLLSSCDAKDDVAMAAEVCRKWDDLIHKDAMRCGELLLPNVSDQCETGIGRTTVLIMRGEPIVDRVLKLYVAEYQYTYARRILAFDVAQMDSERSQEQLAISKRNLLRNRRLLQESIDRHGNLHDAYAMSSSNRGIGENEMDYLTELGTVAESTLSTRIYDEVWGEGARGELWMYYLANVQPKRTLDLLTTGMVGFVIEGQKYAEDTLFRADEVGGIFIPEAFELLALICRYHPVLALENAARIRSFIRDNALHYAEGKKEKHLDLLDYKVRSFALEILEGVGSHEDLEFIQRLATNAPQERSVRRRYGLTLGGDISLRAVSLSERIKGKAQSVTPSAPGGQE